MCEWEQECSDNLLLFDPIFARQYIKERQSWLINKQSMCAKCKLSQNAATLFKEQKNNVHSKTETPETKPASSSIHQQCHDFSNSDEIPIVKSDAKVFTDNFPFQELNSKEINKKTNCATHKFQLTRKRKRAFLITMMKLKVMVKYF